MSPVHLVFMLEEESAGHVLKRLLPRILHQYVLHIRMPPEDFITVEPKSQSHSQCVLTCQLIPHDGGSDLRNSIPTTLEQWLTPDTLFIILHDQDNHPDCRDLKSDLQHLCRNSTHRPLIRIVCRELEAWYCGDLDAVQKAFPGFDASQHRHTSRFRNPDVIDKPSRRLKEIVTGFTKGKAARRVPEYMEIEKNTSVSFNQMVTGMRNFVATRMSTAER